LVDVLLERGFSLSARWMLSGDGDLVLDQPVSNAVGVYAFARGDIVVYVGVATMGVSKRLYFYGRPGISQRTSQRLNATIKQELASASSIGCRFRGRPSTLSASCGRRPRGHR